MFSARAGVLMFRNALWCGNVPSCTLFRKDDELSEFFGVSHSGQPPPQPGEPNPSKRRRPAITGFGYGPQQLRDPNLLTTLARHVIKLEEEIKVLKQDHALVVFPRPGERNVLHHLFQTAKAFQAKQQSNPAWTPGQKPLKTVMAIALFQELGVRLARKCQDEALATLAGEILPPAGISSGGTGRSSAWRRTARYGSGGGCTPSKIDSGLGRGHGASLQCHQKVGRQDRGQRYLPSRSVKADASGPGSMDGSAEVAGQRGAPAGGRGLQARDASPQSGCQEDQGSSTSVLRLAFDNHSSHCYMNSVVQAMLWALNMAGVDGAATGRAHGFFTSLRQYRAVHPKHLMRDLTWRMLTC